MQTAADPDLAAEIKSWKNDSAAAVRLYDGRANESGKIGSAAAAVAAAGSDGRRITQLFIKTRLRKGGRKEPRPKEPKFPSPSLPPRLVKESFNLSPTTTSIDLFKEAQSGTVLRSPKFVMFLGGVQ